MIDELNVAIKEYQEKWRQLVAVRKNKAFFEELRPLAVAWKTSDLQDFNKRFYEIRDHCDQHHLGWLDERWLATSHLRDQKLRMDIELVKLMQRRPGSSDVVGLDHMDFLIPDGTDIVAVLKREPGLKWTEEKGDYAEWISVWFDGGPEAKLRFKGKTTIDAVISELSEVRQNLGL